jgi:transposase-like protein
VLSPFEFRAANSFSFSDSLLECLILLSEGVGLRATSRTKGVSVDSLLSWILKAGHHVNELNAVFKAEMNLTQCQIDEFWSFIQKKKET